MIEIAQVAEIAALAMPNAAGAIYAAGLVVGAAVLYIKKRKAAKAAGTATTINDVLIAAIEANKTAPDGKTYSTHLKETIAAASKKAGVAKELHEAVQIVTPHIPSSNPVASVDRAIQDAVEIAKEERRRRKASASSILPLLLAVAATSTLASCALLEPVPPARTWTSETVSNGEVIILWHPALSGDVDDYVTVQTTDGIVVTTVPLPETAE